MKKKYTKLTHEIFYTKFLIKKITPISEKIKKITPISQNFYTKATFFSHQIRKKLHETLKYLHQIRNILDQTDGTFGRP